MIHIWRKALRKAIIEIRRRLELKTKYFNQKRESVVLREKEKPLFNGKGGEVSNEIILLVKSKVIRDDNEVAPSLGITKKFDLFRANW